MRRFVIDVFFIFICLNWNACDTAVEKTSENLPIDEFGHKLVWEENFDGKMIDLSTWNIELVKSPANQELQEYRAENVTIEEEPLSGNRCLVITAKKEPASNGRSFTSGRVNTMKKFSFKYGRIDASIKLPKTANGLWPAFWMKGNDNDTVAWPSCGEIDILEMGNKDGIQNGTQETLIGHACHWGVNASALRSVAKKYVFPYSLQDDEFHLYTLIWDERKISFYVDWKSGKDPYFVFNYAADKESSSDYFNKEFYILLNLAVGGQYTGIFGEDIVDKVTALNENNDSEAKMYVDYIRVYQKGEIEETLTIKK